MIRKIMAVGIILGLIISILKKWIWVVVGLIALWFIIRWGADIFWWGKDNDKW